MNNSRAYLVSFFMVLVLGAIVANLINIQVVQHKKYANLAQTQQENQAVIPAERGVIMDANGKVLSYTKNDYSFYVNLGTLKSQSRRDSIARRFAKTFGNNEAYYLLKMQGSKGRVCLEKKAEFSKAVLLRDIVFDGFTAEPDYSRVYPEGRLASHILGFVDYKSLGRSGIEKKYEKELRGKDGVLYKRTDVLGTTVAIEEDFSFSPVKGNTIELTINSDYQKILEEELLEGLNTYQGAAATGIIMNPKTGEVLALANMPDYEPGDYGKFETFERKNRAVMEVYEPGSTIKPMIIAMMMDMGLVKLDETIDTENGAYKYHSVKIKDTHPNKRLTVRGVLRESSNIGMVKLSERIEPESFYKYLRNFGFGNPTSVDLPGEAAGFLKKPKYFSKISKAYMSHGYEISVTPLQLTAAFSALINGGTLYQPYTVKRIVAENGDVLKSYDPIKIRSVLTRETSDTLRSLLLDVVEHGTGTTAQLPDVWVGGKTGTSQKWMGDHYSQDEYNSSFVGYLPASDPNLIIFILVHSPLKGKYGGRVAGPIFREVASRIIDTDLNIAPYKEKIIRDKNVLHNLFTEISNTKQTVHKRLLLNIEKPRNEEPIEDDMVLNKGVMPDLKGLSKREAIRRLSEYGLQYTIRGTGKVTEQSIAPGRRIIPGEKCIIRCKLSDNIRYN